MTWNAPAYKPSSSQKQADMFEHAAHDPEYALSRSVPEWVAQGRHAADVAARRWDKHLGLRCVKCRRIKAC